MGRPDYVGGARPVIIDGALEQLQLGADRLVTIASGAIDIGGSSNVRVATEGAASTDDLTDITGGEIGQFVLIRPSDDGDDVVIKHNVAKIICPGGADITLAEDEDFALLYTYDGTQYAVVGYVGLSAAGAGLGALLASTSSGEGASLVGVEDSGAYFTGTTVETVLAELGAVRTYTATGTIPGGTGVGNAGDLNTTPVEVVAAPGAGLYIEFVSAHVFLDYASAAYDGTKTGSASFRYTNAAGDDASGDVPETGFMDQTADTHFQVPPVVCNPVENAALVFASDNDWYSAAGDSPVKYEVLYRIRSFSPS